MSRTDTSQSTNRDGQRKVTMETYRGGKLQSRLSFVDEQRDLAYTLDRRGNTTLGYVARSETGDLPFNPFHYSKLEREWDRGLIQQRQDFGDGYSLDSYSGVLGSNFCTDPLRSFSSATALSLENQAKQKVLEVLKGQNINLALAWAERELTLAMLAKSLSRIGRGHAALWRGDFRGAAAALGVGAGRGNSAFSRLFSRDQSKAVANGWLELQYGWRPLVNDIYGAAQELEQSMNGGRDRYISISKQKKLKEQVSEVRHPWDGANDILEFTMEITKKVMAKYELVIPSLASLSALGFTNPALLAWERVPFSFVVDWAIPIGSWLSSFDSSLGWQLKDAAVTTFEVNQLKANRSASSRPGYTSYFANIDYCQRTVDFNRTPLNVIDMIQTLPAFKDPQSVTHVLNALSLLIQQKR